MGRGILAGLALGVVAGLLFVFHDGLQLSVVWPVVLGFALWEAVGPTGSRGALAALAVAIGAGLGYATFAVVAEFMPVTDISFGIVAGVALAGLFVAGLTLGHRLPLAGLLLGYAAYLGVFWPRWAQSPAAVRSHGIEDLTVSLLGVLIGVLAVTLARMLVEAARVRAKAEQPSTEPPARSATAEGATAGGAAR